MDVDVPRMNSGSFQVSSSALGFLALIPESPFFEKLGKPLEMAIQEDRRPRCKLSLTHFFTTDHPGEDLGRTLRCYSQPSHAKP